MFFIINRHAQGGQGYRIFIKKILPVIKEEISNFGFQVTSSKKETITIARRLVEQKEKTIIACGGDGTVNALTQPLRHTETFLGILPLGSANDFALASLGMPANPIKALYALLDGEEMNIDVGTIKNFSFLNVLGVGIDASITHLAHKHPIFHRMPLKELRYGFPLIQELQNPSFLKVRIIADSQLVFEGNVFYLSIYNGKREGAYFCLNNRGNINDGLLNVVIIENVNFQQRLRYLIETIKGDFKNLPAVHQFEGKEIEVTIFNGNEQIINAQIDGEPIIFESEGSSTVLTIKNDPKALRIIIPKA